MSYSLNFALKAFNDFLKSNDELNRFISNLGRYGSIYLFGGVVRDLCSQSYKNNVLVSDIDLVIDTNVELPDCPKLVVNSFGGYQCFMSDGKSVNYWKLSDTYAFKKNYFLCSLPNLPKTTVFDINAVCYGVFSGEIYERGFERAINNRLISFNCKKYLYDFPEVQAVRAFSYAQKLGFKLDIEVEDFIRDICRGKDDETFIQLLGSSAHRKKFNTITQMLHKYG